MYELFIFSEKLVDNRKKLLVGNSFLIKAKKETNKDGITRVNLDNLFLIDDLKNKKISKVTFEVADLDSISFLKTKFQKEGDTVIEIRYTNKSEDLKFKIDQKKLVKIEDIENLESQKIQAILG